MAQIMTTQADIKLVIDQLDQMAGGDNDMETIDSAIHALETLGNQVAAQKSEIASLRISYDAACMLVAQMHEVVMGKVVGPHHGVVEDVRNHIAAQAAGIEMLRDALKSIEATSSDDFAAESAEQALAIPTDSTQILQEWLDKKLGDPVAQINVNKRKVEFVSHTTFTTPVTVNIPPIPLFKKPEILK